MTDDEHRPVPSSLPGSDEATPTSEPAFLAVGRIVRPHGVRGEMSVEIHTDYPERFRLHRRLYVGLPGQPESTFVPHAVKAHRFHHDRLLLKLTEVKDRDQAEALRDQWLWIPVAEAVKLEEGEVYLHQMIGLRAVTEEGEDLGRIAEIIETGANLVYVVRGNGGEILLPDIADVVKRVDLAAGQMTVRLMEGLR